MAVKLDVRGLGTGIGSDAAVLDVGGTPFRRFPHGFWNGHAEDQGRSLPSCSSVPLVRLCLSL